MKSLIFDTSTEKSFVAFFEEDKLLFHGKLPVGYDSATHLFPTLQKGLLELNWELCQLDWIGVGVGPGSYTGIRIAAMAAKTFSYVSKTPLIAISTLVGCVPAIDTSFAAIIDAKVSGVYLMTGRREGSTVRFLSEPSVCALDHLKETLAGITYLVTPNAKRLQKLLPNEEFEWYECALDPIQMWKEANQQREQGKEVREDELELLYLRKTQAEIERGKESLPP